MVVYNVTEIPIFITTSWEADPFGGPAIRKKTVCIGPGQGAELSMLGLSADRPQKNELRDENQARKMGASRGGLFAQERRWLQTCGNCGHTKMAHRKVAHHSKRQTGPCKEDMKTGFTCPCKEFLK